MFHREIAVVLIVAIPLQGKLVGPDGDAAQAKAAPGGWIKEITNVNWGL